MNKESIVYFLYLLLLLLLQVLLFNHINFLGYANPMVYLLFVLKYPYREDRWVFILLSFLLGLGIDIFSDTGGIFAVSTLIVCYIRPLLLKFSFGNNIEYQRIRLLNFPFGNILLYVILVTLINNTFLYFLEAFTFTQLLQTLMKISVSSILTIVFCMLGIYLFDRKKL